MIRTLLLVTICLAIGFPGPVFSEDLTLEKKADIQKMLDMTGALAMTKQVIDQFMVQITRNIRTRRSDVPEKVIEGLREEVNSVVKDNLSSIVDLMFPLYHKHFTHEEIRGMIQFYSTDLGQKLIRTMPSLMQESMHMGMDWAKSLEPELERRLKKRLLQEGIDLASTDTTPNL